MIYPLIKQLAEETPSKTAFCFDGKTYNYKQFLSCANNLGHELKERLPSNQRICLLSPNLPDAIFLLTGLANTGISVLPLDKFVSATEIREITDQYDIEFMVYHESFKEKVAESLSVPPKTSRLKATDETFYIVNRSQPGKSIPVKSRLTRWLSKEKKTEIEAEDPYVLFSSSGSSGRPKVFELTQSQYYHQIINVRDNFGFTADDSALCALHFSHNHAICLIFSIIAAGGTAHLMPLSKALAPNIIQYISEYQISVFSNVPMIYKAFADLASHLDTSGLRSLRMAICGSAPLSAQVAEIFFDKFGQHLHQSYGLSEIGPVCVNLFEDGIHNYGSVGKIFPQIDFKVVDEDGKIVPPGGEGHLLLKGFSMTNGYLNNPEANAKMFPDGWLHTQDIVQLDSNCGISIIGRRSNFINVGGLKVFPAEIERTIMNMPSVKEVAVVSENDALFGQVIKAFIVKQDDANIQEEDVKSWCVKHLSNFKVPKTVLFTKELPKNAIGKVIGSKLQA
ncbi:MAG: acyl--CoA ligase [Bacteroidetes bacterium]|nr:acyl--CoA ligase [Bacteroidota bacterium]